MCNTTFFRPHELKGPLPLPPQQQQSPFSLSTFQFLRSRLILTNSNQRFMLPEIQSYYNTITDSRTDPMSGLLQPANPTIYNHHSSIALQSEHQLSEANPQQLSARISKSLQSEIVGEANIETGSTTPQSACIEPPEPPEISKSLSTDGRKSDESNISRPNGESPPPPAFSIASKTDNIRPLPSFEYIAPHTKSTIAEMPEPYGGSNSVDLAAHLNFNRIASIGGMIPAFACIPGRRSRGEKRTIPEEQKDEKYYERRKRNNEAAKKSRDARKIREDRTAFRAALLEQENSILRAQVMSLRDELAALKHLLSTTGMVQPRGTTLIGQGLVV